jgi:hypothetical protein
VKEKHLSVFLENSYIDLFVKNNFHLMIAFLLYLLEDICSWWWKKQSYQTKRLEKGN